MSEAERQIGEPEPAVPAPADLEDHPVRPVRCGDVDLHPSFQLIPPGPSGSQARSSPIGTPADSYAARAAMAILRLATVARLMSSTQEASSKTTGGVFAGRPESDTGSALAVRRLHRTVLRLELLERRGRHVVSAEDRLGGRIRRHDERTVGPLLDQNVVPRTIAAQGHVLCALSGHASSLARDRAEPWTWKRDGAGSHAKPSVPAAGVS